MENLTPHLSAAELAAAKLDAARLLTQNNYFEKSPEALAFVEKAMQDFSDPAYRFKFLSLFSQIDRQGLALSSSVLKTIFGKMQLKRSVFMFIKGRDYDNSDLKKAVHNARGIFAAMPENSKFTF